MIVGPDTQKNIHQRHNDGHHVGHFYKTCNLCQAQEAGKVIGTRAGAWFIDGNTSTERCEGILRQIEDCDFDGPSFYEDDYLCQATEEFDLHPDDQSWHGSFAEAAQEAAEAEIVRAARAQLGPDCDPYYNHPED